MTLRAMGYPLLAPEGEETTNGQKLADMGWRLPLTFDDSDFVVMAAVLLAAVDDAMGPKEQA